MQSVYILLVCLCIFSSSIVVSSIIDGFPHSIQVNASASSAASLNGLTKPMPFEVIPLSTSTFAIYVPSTYAVDHALTGGMHESVVDGLARMLVEIAGGCTATPAHGYYRAHSGKLVKERVTILHTFLTLTESLKDELQMMAYDLALRLRQESVLIQMDGMPVLLTPIRRIDQLWMDRTDHNSVVVSTTVH